MEKRGRNDLCWCGSGIKYKKCHLNRSEQQEVPSWEVSNAFRDAHSRKTCLAPDLVKAECSQQIIQAHTIPKSSSLKAISRDGHVYGFVPSLENFKKGNGALFPQLVGVNKASTFTGFCSTHDDSIFSPIEKQEFTSSQEQCFLLAYRALSREVYAKSASASMAPLRKSLDKGKSEEAQRHIQETSFLFDLGVSAGVNDNEFYKAEFDRRLNSGDFSDVRAYIVRLDEPPAVMCSGAFFPEEDFDGNSLQDLVDLEKIPDLVSVNSFASGSYGYVVLSWLSQNDSSCMALVNSLAKIPNDSITPALLRLFFVHFENLYISPVWWEGLSAGQRSSLIQRMSNVGEELLNGRTTPLIADDRVQFDSWPLSARFAVGY